jgi:hypothetical protein
MQFIQMKLIKLAGVLCAVVMLAPSVRADSVSILLDQTNCSGVGCSSILGSGPYGVVDLTLSGGKINFDVQMYEPFYNTGILGIFHGFAFDYNTAYGAAPNIDITGEPSGWSSTNPQSPGSNGGFGPFGKFDYVLGGPGGSGQTPGTGDCTSTGLCDALSFTVAKDGGSFTSVYQLVSPNGVDGFDFATDIRNTANTANTYKLASDGALATPEPRFVALLALVLCGLVVAARRRSLAGVSNAR